MKARAIHRQWKVNRVSAVARDCGRLDAKGQLGTFGVAMLKDARRQALRAGCIGDDVDDATFEGVDERRAAR